MMPTRANEVRVVTGRTGLRDVAQLWEELAEQVSAPVFQRPEWAELWQRHLGGAGEPFLILTEAGDGILPLQLGRRGGLRTLVFMGHGVSDYAGPITRTEEAASRLAGSLRELTNRADLLILRSLSLEEPFNARFVAELPERRSQRLYERCPRVDSTTSWDAFLNTRPSKFRTNYKRMVRKTEAHGTVEVERETPSPALFDEMVDVERASWKWEKGLAYLRTPATRRFLAAVLMESGLATELWTCRVDGSLAGFAVVFRAGHKRHYYLPSYRQDLWGVGVYLMSEILRDSFESEVEEFDFLQGDEEYKLSWMTGERHVEELVLPGGGILGAPAWNAFQLRWKLARSERIKELRRSLLTRWQNLRHR